MTEEERVVMVALYEYMVQVESQALMQKIIRGYGHEPTEADVEMGRKAREILGIPHP